MVVLGGGAVSYERGTPVSCVSCPGWPGWRYQGAFRARGGSTEYGVVSCVALLVNRVGRDSTEFGSCPP